MGDGWLGLGGRAGKFNESKKGGKDLLRFCAALPYAGKCEGLAAFSLMEDVRA